ncbi:MAG: alkaline phosphatase family protein [Rhodocyclaceae bacterium]|nr:alkaline phosphatase family protein [Rhodocyclaceae bacterium]
MKFALRSMLAALALASSASLALAAEPAPHNVVLFVADGLRALAVTRETAPAMAALGSAGVWFKNSHSLFPTFTMPNGSALATGHYFGDTGVFGNTIYTGFPVPAAAQSVTPFLESDAVLGDVDEHFAGNFLDEETLLAAAHRAGFSSAAVGKLGPVAIQAESEPRNSAERIIVIDDQTGRKGGMPLDAALLAELQAAGLSGEAPTRGDNGKAGNAQTPGTATANVEQQRYFVAAVTKVLLPRFKAAGKPFVLVFWSRDPDGTQHNQGDSLGKLVPGINGPTSLAAIRNADANLAAIMAALQALGLDRTTDVVVTADHGFSTISKQSRTSPAAKLAYADVTPGQLPPGFVAIDLAQALELPLFDPDAKNAAVDYASGKHPSRANGLLGADPGAPELVVAANGGSDLVYLPAANARELAPRVVDALLAQDYVSGLFVDDSLGDIPGTLPLSAINLKGSALTPLPAIVVNFRSQATGCKTPVLCTAAVADTGLQQGQGMHGSFSRADTYNFMAATGPDFRRRFIDRAPASNVDIGMTLAAILQLDVAPKGKLVGRVLREAMPGGKRPKVVAKTRVSAAGSHGLRTKLKYQAVGATKYFDAAGFAGRSVGLDAK